MDLKAHAYTCSRNKREVQQNTHQKSPNMHEEHTPADTCVNRQKGNRTNHASMNTQHGWTSRTQDSINFVFWRICWNFPWYVWLFVVYIGVILISCIYLCFFIVRFLMYLCYTSIMWVWFIVVVSFYVCVCIYMYTHLFIIRLYILFYFCLLFIFDYLLFDYCHVYFVILIVFFSFCMNMYVCIDMYFVSHSLIYMYSVLFGLTSLGVNMHTWARVQVFGIDTDEIDPDQDGD